MQTLGRQLASWTKMTFEVNMVVGLYGSEWFANRCWSILSILIYSSSSTKEASHVVNGPGKEKIPSKSGDRGQVGSTAVPTSSHFPKYLFPGEVTLRRWPGPPVSGNLSSAWWNDAVCRGSLVSPAGTSHELREKRSQTRGRRGERPWWPRSMTSSEPAVSVRRYVRAKRQRRLPISCSCRAETRATLSTRRDNYILQNQ